MATKKTEKKPKRTLKQFARAAMLKDCRVCQLVKGDILEQVRNASQQSINLDVVVAWLKEEHGILLSRDELLTHRRGAHDNV